MSSKRRKPIEGEIVTPEMLDRVLGKSKEPDIPALDALLERFEELFESSLKMTDLNSPESWFGELFGGMDYRIAIKTERGQAIVALIDLFMRNLDQFEEIEKKIRIIHRERHQRYIERIQAARTALEEQQKLEAVAAQARLQLQIEAAKAEAEIEKHRKAARDARREPLPPPPPPMPAPVVDECERKRQAAQKERKLEYDLKMDAVEAEAEYQDTLTGTATARILKIFADSGRLRSQKRMSIRNLIDSYGIVETFLPAGVQELLQEESE